EIVVLNSGQVIAEQLVEYLSRHSEYDQPSKDEKRMFLTTNSSEKFDLAAQKFLGRKIKSRTISF
ncbi:glutamate racemase, partial [bacterium]|nr:glutamate racemase [bacterium]